MEDRLKQLMEKLGISINHSLRESAEVAEVLSEIREAGYDVFLMLEATVGFQKREEKSGEEASAGEGEAKPASGQLVLSPGDAEFLQSLRIRLDPIKRSPKQES